MGNKIVLQKATSKQRYDTLPSNIEIPVQGKMKITLPKDNPAETLHIQPAMKRAISPRKKGIDNNEELASAVEIINEDIQNNRLSSPRSSSPIQGNTVSTPTLKVSGNKIILPKKNKGEIESTISADFSTPPNANKIVIPLNKPKEGDPLVVASSVELQNVVSPISGNKITEGKPALTPTIQGNKIVLSKKIQKMILMEIYNLQQTRQQYLHLLKQYNLLVKILPQFLQKL